MAAALQNHGLQLTVEEAAAEVEAYYTEQEAAFERAKLRRAKKLIAEAPEARSEPVEARAAQAADRAMNTVRNNDSRESRLVLETRTRHYY